MPDKKKVLLHICCCGCASVSIDRLQSQGYEVYGFFYNPNIHPRPEYERRKKDLNILRDRFSLEIIEGDYNPGHWFSEYKQYADDPEGGRRCLSCYRERLLKTYQLCCRKDYDFFTTSLTISPHKHSTTVFEIGRDVGGDFFLEKDFKKKDGFKQSVEFSRKHGLYRQDYCGCVYSLLERRAKCASRGGVSPPMSG